jgi:phosphatidylglycerophosphate synthase
VFADLEKRALIWIATRLPGSINSDHLSALGLAAMAATGVALAAIAITPWAALVAVVCLAANWFGDSLDGTVARVRRQERPRYGYYVDHVIDLTGTTMLIAGLAVSGLMDPVIALGVLVAYLLVCGEVYLATHVTGTFRMSFLGWGPTELRILLAAGILKAAWEPLVSLPGLGRVPLFDVGGVVAIIGMSIAFAVAVWRNTRALARAEPRPLRRTEGPASAGWGQGGVRPPDADPRGLEIRAHARRQPIGAGCVAMDAERLRREP